jgi:O-antigen ligase
VLDSLLTVSVLVWLPVLFYWIGRKGFLLLLIWLLMAPVAVNLVNNPGTNPFFNKVVDKPGLQEAIRGPQGGYLLQKEATIKLKDLLEPNRIILGSFFVVFLANALLKRKRLGPFDNTEKFAFVFSLLLIASSAIQSQRAAFSLRVACDAFIIPFIGYFCTRRLVTEEDQLHKLTEIMGYLGFYVIVIGFVERLTESGLYSRIEGPFAGRDELYIVMAVVFFTVLLNFVPSDSVSNSRKQWSANVLQQFVLCFAPVIVLLGWGRGNVVALLSGMWVFALMGRKLVNLRSKMATAGLVLLLGPIVGLGLYGFTPQEIIEGRIVRASSVYSRVGAWQNMIAEISTSRFFGIGLNNLRDVLQQKKSYVEGVKSETHPHNSPLSILVELGFVGFLIFAGILKSIIGTGLNLYRRGPNIRDRWRGTAIISIVVAYIVSSLFTNLLYLTSVSHVYVYVFLGGIAGIYGRGRSVAARSHLRAAA